MTFELAFFAVGARLAGVLPAVDAGVDAMLAAVAAATWLNWCCNISHHAFAAAGGAAASESLAAGPFDSACGVCAEGADCDGVVGQPLIQLGGEGCEFEALSGAIAAELAAIKDLSVAIVAS